MGWEEKAKKLAASQQSEQKERATREQEERKKSEDDRRRMLGQYERADRTFGSRVEKVCKTYAKALGCRYDTSFSVAQCETGYLEMCKEYRIERTSIGYGALKVILSSDKVRVETEYYALSALSKYDSAEREGKSYSVRYSFCDISLDTFTVDRLAEVLEDFCQATFIREGTAERRCKYY
jgi:hypothetical protein